MIFLEDQEVKVDGVMLPGVLKKIEVKESAKIDEQEVEGSAARPKQATGYEDVKISIELLVDDTETQTKYQRLATLRSIFRSPGLEVPQPIPIISEDTAAHGVDRVLFKSISHSRENKKGQLPVLLEFWEYVPQTITTVKSTEKKPAGSNSGGGSALSSDYTSYLSGSRGTAPKTKGSPAVDDAPTAVFTERGKQIL